MQALIDWFRTRGWKPFDFQRETWTAYLAGRSGLLHAPTGMGKTYAVWGGPLLEALAGELEGRTPVEHSSGGAPPALQKNQALRKNQRLAASARSRTPSAAGRRQGPPLKVLWLTPLRALAYDTTRALEEPLEDLRLPWTVEMRTGDTPQSVKRRQAQRLPTALVTTPESLSLLLSYGDGPRRFGDLRCIIVDEWHELLGSKRGVQAELCLARLRTLAPSVRTWGLSATLGNTEEAMNVLLGPHGAPSGRLIRGDLPKAFEVDSLKPESVERFPWAGHLGLKLLDQAIEAIESAQSTLMFTNVRSQAEQWFQALIRAKPQWVGAIALHHGSLDREIRAEVENLLRQGKLRCVVCTSSLDLGVDFTPVDQVIQVGSPKGVARMLQRAGRSGHQPGATSRIVGLPTNALELVEYAAAREAVAARRVESREPIDRAIDVLVQHLVTIALGDGFQAQQLLAEVRSTHAFRSMSDVEWQWTLDFVKHGGATLQAYPRYSKVVVNEGLHAVESRQIARLHRMSIGTITSDGALLVRFVRGGTLGTIEESFISRLRPGDRFVFAGRKLRLKRVRNMTAYVERVKGGSAIIPRWMGGRSPLSTEMADAIRDKLQEARDGVFDDPEMQLVRPLLELQAKWSIIPAAKELLIEKSRYRGAHHVFVFTIAGRLVNEGLSALVGFRLTRQQPRSISMSANDYGFEIMSPTDLPFDEATWRVLLSTKDLLDDLLASLNSIEMARRHFREIARVAGLVIQGFPGQQKSLRQLQASSELFYEVFREFDPQNLLLEQAQREVLDRELEMTRLRRTLEHAAGQQFKLVETKRFTPLAFPLWVDTIRTSHASSERWIDRVQRMAAQLEKAAGG